MQQVPKGPQDIDDFMDSDYRAAGRLQHLTPEFQNTHSAHFLGCPFVSSFLTPCFSISGLHSGGARGIIWKHH